MANLAFPARFGGDWSLQMNHAWFLGQQVCPKRTEIIFPCHPSVVGHLAGRKWKYIKDFCKAYEDLFNNETISITYDGCCFRVHVAHNIPGIHFISQEFGQRVFIANHGIHAEPAGAIIGKEGWWLRKTEEEQTVPCIIYHECGQFFLKFPISVTTQERLKVLDDVRRKIMGRVAYLHHELSDTESMSTTMSEESFDSIATDESFDSIATDNSVETYGPTPAEAYR